MDEKLYERIYLQYYDEDGEYLEPQPPQWDGPVTWCSDKIHDTDVEYVRADTVDALRARIAELEQALAEPEQPKPMTTLDELKWLRDHPIDYD